MKVKALGIVAGALIAAAPLVSSAASLPAPFEGSSTLQADGVVKSVDQTNHSVTVLDAQGGEASFTITDTHNLAQIKQGGKVHIRMMRNADRKSTAFSLWLLLLTPYILDRNQRTPAGFPHTHRSPRFSRSPQPTPLWKTARGRRSCDVDASLRRSGPVDMWKTCVA